MKNCRIAVAFILAVGCGIWGWGHLSAEASENESEPLTARVFELRTYTTHPGKLPDLLTRFRDHTNVLFVKHGMTLVGYWTPNEGEEAENTLIYIVAHEDRESANQSWEAFRKDPAWNKAKEESRANGPLVSKVERKYLNPTDFSPLR